MNAGTMEVEGQKFIWLTMGAKPTDLIEVYRVANEPPKITHISGFTENPAALAETLINEMLRE